MNARKPVYSLCTRQQEILYVRQVLTSGSSPAWNLEQINRKQDIVQKACHRNLSFV